MHTSPKQHGSSSPPQGIVLQTPAPSGSVPGQQAAPAGGVSISRAHGTQIDACPVANSIGTQRSVGNAHSSAVVHKRRQTASPPERPGPQRPACILQNAYTGVKER